MSDFESKQFSIFDADTSDPITDFTVSINGLPAYKSSGLNSNTISGSSGDKIIITSVGYFPFEAMLGDIGSSVFLKRNIPVLEEVVITGVPKVKQKGDYTILFIIVLAVLFALLTIKQKSL